MTQQDQSPDFIPYNPDAVQALHDPMRPGYYPERLMEPPRELARPEEMGPEERTSMIPLPIMTPPEEPGMAMKPFPFSGAGPADISTGITGPGKTPILGQIPSAGKPFKAPEPADAKEEPTIPAEETSQEAAGSSFVTSQPEGEVVIPATVEGKSVSEEEAVEHYKETGEHLGIFETPKAAQAHVDNLRGEAEAKPIPELAPMISDRQVLALPSEIGVTAPYDWRSKKKRKG